MRDCIICKQNLLIGQIAPKNWTLCIECHEKGYRVCKEDNKIFNIRELKKEYSIDKPQTFILINNQDYLEKVKQKFENMKYYEQNICSNRCFNILYIKECIEELSAILMCNLLNNKEKQEIFNKEYEPVIQNKIKELEELKKNYLQNVPL
jgi:hypothetical protein